MTSQSKRIETRGLSLAAVGGSVLVAGCYWAMVWTSPFALSLSLLFGGAIVGAGLGVYFVAGIAAQMEEDGEREK